MLIYLHEARTPRFGRRISEFQKNFVRGNTKLQAPMFFGANTEDRLAKTHLLADRPRSNSAILAKMPNTSRAFGVEVSTSTLSWSDTN
jgi:hypothetical protein